MRNLLLALTFISVACTTGIVALATPAPTDNASTSKTPASISFKHKKGTLKTRTLMWPSTFNAFTSRGAYIGVISSFVQASLLNHSAEDWSTIPYLAEKWQISDDLKTVTFELNSKATFGSGKPVTAADVKFTFDLIYDEKRCLKCAFWRGFIGELESVKVLSPLKVAITTKEVHFYNLNKIGSVAILEKAIFEKGDFNQDFNKVIHGAGPYLYDAQASAHKKRIVLKRRKDFWLHDHPYYHQRYNFDTINFKYISDNSVAFEGFKRGDLDYYYFDYNAFKFWDDKKSKIFKNPDVVRLEAPFNNPYTFHLIAFNLRKGKTKEQQIRHALDHLMNRPLIEQKIFAGHNKSANGPFPPGPYSKSLPPTKYDPAQAAKLLKQAGFTEVGGDGILYRTDAQGKKERAAFSLIHTKTAYEPWLTIFVEDAKKAGVEINVRLVEWSLLTTKIQDFSWELAAFGLLAPPVPLPRSMWHSEGAMSPGSSNYMGVADPEIDRLTEQIGITLDAEKRYPLYHQLEKKLLELRPMMFLWTQKKHYVAYWKNRLHPTATPYFFYSGDNLSTPFYLHWTAR